MTKKIVIEALESLPEDKFENYENIIEEIILLKKVEAGLKDMREGQTLSEDELDQEIAKW